MNERPIEYGFVFAQIALYGPHTLLDVGCGRSALPAVVKTCGIDVTATDPGADYWRGRRYHNPHFPVVRDDICATTLSGPYDMVTCISTLEHIAEADTAVAAMLGLLRPGGALVLTFPWAATHVPDTYALPDAGYTSDGRYICTAFCREDVRRWCDGKARIAALERWRVFTGGMWTVGDRLAEPELAIDCEGDLACVTLIRR